MTRMTAKGILTGVGIGPGDPELLTLKAVRTIAEADVIALPKTDEQYITALEIVKTAVDISAKDIIELYLPMTRDAEVLAASHQKAAEQIAQLLRAGKKVAFLTLGDPTIYSTYLYIHERVLKAGLEAQLVPGVPSFCAVAAKLNTALCKAGEPLHIIPASYHGEPKYLDWSGTKVLMKSGKSLQTVIEALRARNMLDSASMVERCGMSEEKIYTDLNAVNTRTSYFSTIIVKDKASCEEEQI